MHRPQKKIAAVGFAQKLDADFWVENRCEIRDLVLLNYLDMVHPQLSLYVECQK